MQDLFWNTENHSLASQIRQTPASELIRVVDKIGEKVLDRKRGQPTKFPEPSWAFIHMVLVDMRGFEGTGDPDPDHLLQIAYGAADPRVECKEFVPGLGTPVQGLFELANERPAAMLARSRLHYLGFICEEDFSDDEIRLRTRFIRNDQRATSSKAASAAASAPSAGRRNGMGPFSARSSGKCEGGDGDRACRRAPFRDRCVRRWQWL